MSVFNFPFNSFCFKISALSPGLVWLYWWSKVLQTKRSWVKLPVRAHISIVSSVPVGAHMRGNQSMFLSYIDISLTFYLPPFPAL